MHRLLVPSAALFESVFKQPKAISIADALAFVVVVSDTSRGNAIKLDAPRF